MLKGKDLGLYQGKGKPRKVALELEEPIAALEAEKKEV